jgi:hypothetical protein
VEGHTMGKWKDTRWGSGRTHDGDVEGHTMGKWKDTRWGRGTRRGKHGERDRGGARKGASVQGREGGHKQSKSSESECSSLSLQCSSFSTTMFLSVIRILRDVITMLIIVVMMRHDLVRSSVKGGMHTRHAPAASATAFVNASTTACVERGGVSEEGRAGKAARSPQTAHGGRADGGRKKGIGHQQNDTTIRSATWHYEEKHTPHGMRASGSKQEKQTERKNGQGQRGPQVSHRRTQQVKSSQVK